MLICVVVAHYIFTELKLCFLFLWPVGCAIKNYFFNVFSNLVVENCFHFPIEYKFALFLDG